MSAVATPAARPRTVSSLVALYRLLLRTQVTVPRLLGVGALAGLALLLGVLARWDDDPVQAAAEGIAAYGLGVVVPLAALWFGASAVGDLIEDRLLVYLWLKPVPRWQLPAAAILATLTIVVPLAVLPLAAAALVAGAGNVAAAALLAATLAALAYSGIFVAAGIWFRRAVWWGLAFVLIWENVAAYTAGTGRFSVIGWSSALLGLASGVDVEIEAGSAGAALVVLPAVAIAGWLVGTWRYRRVDID
jgi:ABC-2 type transport system permease protein